ncbi:MAG: LamG domain-containing protein, partial [Leptolyngbyaceae cyanobacterium RU_5_1]|nr:LamG domain-containing protein [Leptolyngbyaceae cyanobacterium RU_5_1]
FKDAALVFQFDKASRTSPLTLPPLGSLDITTLEMGATTNPWDQLQALYTFEEGNGSIVYDVSRIGTPLDLIVQDPENTRWSGDGLVVADSTVIVSTNLTTKQPTPASKIINACIASKEVTIAAWVKPAKADQETPARIVTLGADASDRNISLQQGVWDPDQNETQNVYGTHLRTTHTNKSGEPPLVATKITPTTDLVHLVYTRTAQGLSRLYINGVEQASGTLGGDFSTWATDYPLALANEVSGDRAWLGEYRLIAIYSRALSPDEAIASYYPTIRMSGTLTLTQVPAPLNGPLPVTLSHSQTSSVLTVNQTATLLVATGLQFDQVTLSWQQTGTAAPVIAGTIAATLWDNPLHFAISLSANQFLLSVIKPVGVHEIHLPASGRGPLQTLGHLTLAQFNLLVDRTVSTPAWTFQTDARITFTVIPPPLKGPFPVQFLIEDGRVWLSLNPTAPLAIVEALACDRVNLKFAPGQADWDIRGDISVSLFGQSLPLVPSFVQIDTTRVFQLEYRRDPEQTQTLSNPPGQLQLFSFILKTQPTNKTVFWQLAIAGYLGLKRADTAGLVGLLLLKASGQVVGNPDQPQSPTSLQDKQSTLQSLMDTIFSGDLSFERKRDRVILALVGKLTLFPAGRRCKRTGMPGSKSIQACACRS